MDAVNGGGGGGGGGEEEEEEEPRVVVARACLLNTCGLPGAGKSTLARALAERVAALNDDVGRRHNIRVSLVSFDDIERELMERTTTTTTATTTTAATTRRSADRASGGGEGVEGRHEDGAGGDGAIHEYDAAVWRAARKEAFARLDALLTADDDDETKKKPLEGEVEEEEEEEEEVDDDGAAERRRRHLVIADDNFYYASMRYQVHQLARRTASAHVQLYVDVTADVAHERNESRVGDARVPRDALDRMAAALEPPDPDKRAFERDRTIVVDATSAAADAVDGAINVDEVWERVLSLWGTPPPVPATEEEREAQR